MYQLDERGVEAAVTIMFSSKTIQGTGIKAKARAICHCSEIDADSDIIKVLL